MKEKFERRWWSWKMLRRGNSISMYDSWVYTRFSHHEWNCASVMFRRRTETLKISVRTSIYIYTYIASRGATSAKNKSTPRRDILSMKSPSALCQNAECSLWAKEIIAEIITGNALFTRVKFRVCRFHDNFLWWRRASKYTKITSAKSRVYISFESLGLVFFGYFIANSTPLFIPTSRNTILYILFLPPWRRMNQQTRNYKIGQRYPHRIKFFRRYWTNFSRSPDFSLTNHSYVWEQIFDVIFLPTLRPFEPSLDLLRPFLQRISFSRYLIFRKSGRTILAIGELFFLPLLSLITYLAIFKYASIFHGCCRRFFTPQHYRLTFPQFEHIFLEIMRVKIIR